MLEKMRQVAVDPGPVPHCQHWASHEAVRNEHGTTKAEASV
jgi:primosomal replication protein N